MSVAPLLLVSTHPARNTVNTRKQNRYHTPLISTYFIASKFASASKCDVLCELYRSKIALQQLLIPVSYINEYLYIFTVLHLEQVNNVVGIFMEPIGCPNISNVPIALAQH